MTLKWNCRSVATLPTSLSPTRSFSWRWWEVPDLSLTVQLCLPAGGSCTLEEHCSLFRSTAGSTKLCLLPLHDFQMLTLSWVRSQNHHIMVTWFELHRKWILALSRYFHHAQYLFLGFFPPHLNTHLLSDINPAPSTANDMSNSCPEVYKFWMVLFWNRRWVVLNRFCTII